jgi:hypothetical protein
MFISRNALNVLLTASLVSLTVGEEITQHQRVCQVGDAEDCEDHQNFLDEGGDALSLLQAQMSLREVSAHGLESSVDNLVQTAFAMLNENGGKITPAVQKFIAGMLKDLGEMMLHVESAHKSDQAKLDGLYKKIADAIAALEAKKAELEKVKLKIGNQFTELKACRQAESDIYKKWLVCLSQQKALQEIKDTKSAATASVLGTFSGMFTGDPSVEDMLEADFRAGVSSTIDKFEVANTELNVAITNLEAKIEECRGIAKTLGKARSNCNALQKTFELDFTAYAMDIKATCTDFDEEYSTLSGLFAAAQTTAKKMEADRKVEFTGLKLTDCVLATIHDKSESGSLSTAGLEKCKKSEVSVDHLNIKYDDTPEKPACPPVPPYPCMKAFLEKYYSDMPTGTKAAKCIR